MWQSKEQSDLREEENVLRFQTLKFVNGFAKSLHFFQDNPLEQTQGCKIAFGIFEDRSELRKLPYLLKTLMNYESDRIYI